MSLSFLDNVDYNGKKPNFNRDLFDTVAQMKAFSENYLPDVFIASCKADGKQYVYNKNNTVDETTGKWRLLTSGGSGGGAVDSVNGKTGAVTLTASDVGALADSTDIPSKTSDLTNDSNFVADANYQHTDNNFTNDLKTAYDGAVTDKHTHSNKTVLDAITSEVKSGYDSAVTNSHSHDNKSVIDKFTESADGKPLYDGNAIGGSGGTTIVVGNGGDSYYSTSEIVIGSYLGKPLYRKVIIGTTETRQNIDISNLNPEKIVNITANSGMYSYQHITPTDMTWSSSVYVDGNTIQLRSGSSVTALSENVNITIDYTKTTDTANSSPIARPTVYSTDEVCVGTYKGKPLYRKLMDITLSAQRSITHEITDFNVNVDDIYLGNASYLELNNLDPGGKYPMSFYHGVDSNYSVSSYVKYINNKLYLYSRNGANISTGTITFHLCLEYTKTT